MRRHDEHHHTCSRCGHRYPCHGPLEQNYDGWPEVICLAYHEGGETICEECGIDADEEREADHARA